ncbi:MAG: IS110 family transposase [Chloroflexota bacterium]|nr:IS110 family transposase [Chloroflexota bacterium]
MTMLADRVDAVIGVDTHKHTHTAAVVTPTGGLVDHVTVPTDTAGAKRMLAFAHRHAPGRRVWAIEGTGCYGAGLTTSLLEQGEWVVEIDRPRRPARRNGAKSDELDAVRAAREALGRAHLAQPRRRGDREALRVLLCTREAAVRGRTRSIAALHALVVSAPEGLRRRLRHLGTRELTARCARLRAGTTRSSEQRATIMALRSTARRALACETEAAELESALQVLVETLHPDLLAEPGVGVLSAARILNAWSHAGRIRSEAAFAMLAGVAPVEASSGQTVRHRLNRSGDRQLNRALHTIVLVRLAHDAETRAYARRRTEEGKTPREIKRCLKRHVARRIFRLLEDPAQAT